MSFLLLLQSHFLTDKWKKIHFLDSHQFSFDNNQTENDIIQTSNDVDVA